MVDIEHPPNRFEKIAATNMPERPLGIPTRRSMTRTRFQEAASRAVASGEAEVIDLIQQRRSWPQLSKSAFATPRPCI
jgi:hypothetical protein